MVVERHSSTEQMEDNGQTRLQAADLPIDLQIQVMEQYVDKHYSVIDIRSVADFDAIVEEIRMPSENTFPWEAWKGAIETALFSSAAFRLDVTFVDKVDGSTTAQIPTAVFEILRRIQKLELLLNVGASTSGGLADGSQLLRAIRGMASLKEQFHWLDTLRLYLVFDAAFEPDDVRNHGVWQFTKLEDGPGVPWPHPWKPWLNTTIYYLTKATRDHGPGKTKIFAFSAEKRIPSYEIAGNEIAPVDQQVDLSAWKPWVVRNIRGVEFGSREKEDDLDGVLDEAWDDRSELSVESEDPGEVLDEASDDRTELSVE